jgi:ATP-dependent DNA helicase RecQ
VAEEHASLLSSLKAKRRALAEAAGVPAYVVFPDRTLIEMAEKRPSNLDEMMGITGVGAKKLESYGKGFLAVITRAEAGAMHPARRKLVGRDAGQIFDRLSEVQVQLQRGADGIGKPLSLTSGALRKIAEVRPSTLSDLDRVGDLGPQKIERFGAAFLDVLREA